MSHVTRRKDYSQRKITDVEMINASPATAPRAGNDVQFDVCALGESMLRLNPPHHQRLAQSASLEMRFSGAESNVLSALARWGRRTAWLGRMPDNALGQRALAEFRAMGLDVRGARLAPGERMGTYFVELADEPRANRVIYDRAQSAAARMTWDDVDTATIAASRWLHLTGITPALSAGCHDLTLRAAEFARANGVTVSLDVNYRGLLWTHAQARAGLLPILRHVDVLISAHRDAVSIFGVGEDPAIAAQTLRAQSAAHTVVLTTGEGGALALSGDAAPVSAPGFKVSAIVDRIGAGDAFDAGFIHGSLQQWPLEQRLRFGHAASALKLTIAGDVALIEIDEVEALMQGGGAKTVR